MATKKQKSVKYSPNGDKYEPYDVGAVRFDETTLLTSEQKARARQNIGAGEDGVVAPTTSLLRGNGSGSAVAATAGTHYVAPRSENQIITGLEEDSGEESSLSLGGNAALSSDGEIELNSYGDISLSSNDGDVNVDVAGGMYLNGVSVATVNDIPQSVSSNVTIYRDTTGTAAVTTSPYTGAKWNVTDSTVTEYQDGMMVSIKVPVVGSSTYGTAFQINSLGYHPVVYNVNSMIGTRYGVGGQVVAVYNATQTASWYNNSSSASTITGCWQIMDYDANDVNYNARDYYLRRTATDAIYRNMFCVTDGKYIIPVNTTNNSTSSTKTSGFTTREFDPFGNIYYYSNTSTTISANSLVNNTSFFIKSTASDLRYAFNGVTTSTSTSKFAAGDAAYLVCVPQSSGKVKLYYGTSGTDYAACLSKALPSSEDGLVYIYLGQMFDTYRVELSVVKQPYCFKDGKICEYTGEIKSVDVTDNSPYLFRASGGNASIGSRVSENWIEGGSVAVNQLIPDSYSSESIAYGGGTGTKTATTISLTGTTGTYTYAAFTSRRSLNNHIYLIVFNVDSISSGISSVWCKANNTNNSVVFPANTGIFATVNKSFGADGQYIIGFSVASGSVSGQTMTISKMQEIDLSRMFGQDTAEHLATLSNEVAIDILRPWIDVNVYHPYNAGVLESVNLLKKKTTGLNQWDEVWELGYINETTGLNASSTGRIRGKNYMKALPNTSYCLGYVGTAITGSSLVLDAFWYNANKEFIGLSGWKSKNTVVISPAKAAYFRIGMATAYGATYKNDICINISDASHNGTYDSYKVYEYSMPSGDLYGVSKFVNNNIVYDGNRYYPDGRKETRFAIVDLGSLTWSYSSSLKYFSTTLSDVKPTPNTSTVANIICTLYTADSATNIVNNAASYNKSIAINQLGDLFVSDQSYSTAAAFKTAMNGVYLVYEKASSTTSTGTPYQQTQLVDNFGSEEFVTNTGNTVPVGHNSTYLSGFDDKLMSLPENASSDGLYVIRQTGKYQSLEKYNGGRPSIEEITLSESDSIELEDNIEYYLDATECSGVDLFFPDDFFKCLIYISFGDQGTTVYFPSNTRYIGSIPQFGNSETWEISIKNGIVVAGKIEVPDNDE